LLCSFFDEDTSRLLGFIKELLSDIRPLYVVGGAVRDAFLGKVIKDLDISTRGDVFSFARKIANGLEGAYYPMDEEHGTARVVLEKPGGEQFFIDLNRLRGNDINEDLADRDFTINAMAIDIFGNGNLIDPLHGARDLHEKKLVLCSPVAINRDPVRAIRGIRFSVEFDLSMPSETKAFMKEGARSLPGVSAERIRDELFKMLGGKDPALCILLLDRIRCLNFTLPELESLKGVRQSIPHIDDVWRHTINTARQLDGIVHLFTTEHDPDFKANFFTGYLFLKLGRFKHHIADHLHKPITTGRSRKSLLMLAALYHDTGKPSTQTETDEGKIRFLEHEEVSAELVKRRAKILRLSNDEVDAVTQIILSHMRPILLSNQAEFPTSRAIYRYFRKTGPLGIDISLLSLADTLATYGPTLPQDRWIKFVDIIRVLMDAWWEKPEEMIYPPNLLTGDDLISYFGLKPGPTIGRLLESLRLAQVESRVMTREQAFEHVKNVLEEMPDEQSADTN
jgi:putative nucleotidyltransferase with HDIG domain